MAAALSLLIGPDRDFLSGKEDLRGRMRAGESGTFRLKGLDSHEQEVCANSKRLFANTLSAFS